MHYETKLNLFHQHCCFIKGSLNSQSRFTMRKEAILLTFYLRGTLNLIFTELVYFSEFSALY